MRSVGAGILHCPGGLLNVELDTRTVHYDERWCFNMYKDMESFVEAEGGKTCWLGRVWWDSTDVTFELRPEAWVAVCQRTEAPPATRTVCERHRAVRWLLCWGQWKVQWAGWRGRPWAGGGCPVNKWGFALSGRELRSLPHTAFSFHILNPVENPGASCSWRHQGVLCVWHWAWHTVGAQQTLIPALFLVRLLLSSPSTLLLLTGSSSAYCWVSGSDWFLFSFSWLLSLTKSHPLIYHRLIDRVFSTTVKMSTLIYLLSFSCWVFLFPLWYMTFPHVTL